MICRGLAFQPKTGGSGGQRSQPKLKTNVFFVNIEKKLEKVNNVKKILLTTSTVSSAKVFKKIKLKKTFHKFYPLDTNHITKKFISCWKPQLAIFVDSEIWPNMLKNLKKNKIPTILINARITNKSFKRWKIFGTFANEVFSKITIALLFFFCSL